LVITPYPLSSKRVTLEEKLIHKVHLNFKIRGASQTYFLPNLSIHEIKGMA